MRRVPHFKGKQRSESVTGCINNRLAGFLATPLELEGTESRCALMENNLTLLVHNIVHNTVEQRRR
jgi:hypothetical protein